MGLTTSIPSAPSKNSDPVVALIESVGRLADDVLFPAAAEIDRADGLRSGHFEALAALGLYGMAVPVDQGGLGLSGPEIRRILRIVGSGCGATSFAFAQHHGTAAAVAATANEGLRERWLSGIVTDQLVGIAYAHVRRGGPPVLVAEPRSDGGWTFDGSAPWVTSWGLATAMAVAAVTEDGRMVWALVPAVEGPGLAVSRTFDLMVYGATQTVALGFDRFVVGPEMVLNVVDIEQWAARDRYLAARPNPLCMGVGDRALAQLAVIEPEPARDLQSWWDGICAGAEAQALAVENRAARLEDVAAARAETLMAVQRLTNALLAAVGGGAMERSHPAQRLCREALFYVIQAQSSDGRRAMFDQLRP